MLTLLGFALVSGRLRHDVFSVFFVFLSPYLSFVLVSLWFYKYQALSVNAAALLVMQHPLGKTVLGLMSDSATAIATKMPQSTSSRLPAASTKYLEPVTHPAAPRKVSFAIEFVF